MMRTADKPVVEVAEDIGVSEQSLYRWAKQLGVGAKAASAGVLTTSEREELTRLRRAREDSSVAMTCRLLKVSTSR
ncbi:MAG: transposase [Nannocystaceae bacterium]|nr:transposase [Nannocystaceae bacterium]